MSPPLSRHGLLQPGLALLILFLLVHPSHSATIGIDDADPRIQYTGNWGPGPQDIQRSGTLMYSNTSGDTATVTFTGGAVSVYGVYAPVGTFHMRSQYSVDNGPPTVFSPPSVVQEAQAHRRFFASGEIAYGVHVLTFENLGEQYWFDYIEILETGNTTTTAPPPETALPSAGSPARSVAGTTASPGGESANGMGNEPPPTDVPSGSASGAVATRRSSAGQAQSALPAHDSQAIQSKETSLSQTSAAVSSETASTEPVRPSTPTSSGAPGKSTGQDIGSQPAGTRGRATLKPGTIVGIAVAGIILLLALLGLRWRWRQRRHPQRQIIPFGFDCAELGVPIARRPKSERDTPYPVGAGACTALPEQDLHRASSLRLPDDAIWEDLPSAAMSIKSNRVLCNALTSSESSGRQDPTRIDGAAADIVYVATEDAIVPATIPGVMRRRSIDGGQRLAGGPPGGEFNVEDTELLSSVSTLPPAYQVYPM